MTVQTKAVIKIAGKPIDMVDEAMQSSNYKLYTIVNATKTAWDYNTPVKVYVNGQPATPLAIYRASGQIMMPSALSASDVVTVDGAYVTSSRVALVQSYDVSNSRESIEVTAIDDDGMRRIATKKSASGSFDTLEVLNKELLATLDSDYVLLEVYDDVDTDRLQWRSWVIINSQDFSASASDLQTLSINFESTGDFLVT